MASSKAQGSKILKGDQIVKALVKWAQQLSWRLVTYCAILLSMFVTAFLLRIRLFEETNVRPIDILRESFIAHEGSVAVRALEPISSNWNDTSVVEDVVIFPEGVMLLIKTCKGCRLTAEDHDCVYDQNEHYPITIVDEKEPGLHIARCPHPQEQISSHCKSVTLGLRETGAKLPSRVKFPGHQVWDMLVYEIFPLKDSTLLFVKAPNFRRLEILDPKQLSCFYGSNVKTRVLDAAQEVVRCERPPRAVEKSLRGVKVSVWVSTEGLLPSIARFNPSESDAPQERLPWSIFQLMAPRPRKKHFVCACSMIWNQARFLKEWIMYHGWLGVERWFLYDNNSEDNTREVIQSLSSFNVSRHVWPWIKTQEAGFSHCAVKAQQECEWIIFIDVDEFIYPRNYLRRAEPRAKKSVPKSSANQNASVLKRLILSASDSAGFKVGDIRIDCHNFGPSGLTERPKEGVTVGYSCRLRASERHKSIVRVDALSRNLLNVVHHFNLKPGFKSMRIPRTSTVINHYKYQVWVDFQRKFIRRVATYVTDWREKLNENSKDRTPGLGTEPIEPDDWPARFCELNDTGLRDFVLKTFRHPAGNRMLWQQLL